MLHNWFTVEILMLDIEHSLSKDCESWEQNNYYAEMQPNVEIVYCIRRNAQWQRTETKNRHFQHVRIELWNHWN